MSWHSFHSKRRETAKRRVSASITAILIPFSKFSSGISEGESAIRKLSRPCTYVYNGKEMSRAFCLTYLVNSSDERLCIETEMNHVEKGYAIDKDIEDISEINEPCGTRAFMVLKEENEF
ncbi:hypothetical protein CDAR_219621 [Caerostris darwini]|uniref:Uncharacterized protein n=1 Tax=Caerostris darwini TaxID=1538125 RepID=A0AAV4TDP4_9ARAC|nr:hypothetical protein CDAR_219621 [Caerostris darwini]